MNQPEHSTQSGVEKITRREFIERSGQLSTVVLATDLYPFSIGKKPRVVVLGAGLSGLAAAYQLIQKNYEVTVLESRGRIGGRVFSHAIYNDLTIELGGEWVGENHLRMQELCDEFKLNLIDNRFDTHLIYKGQYFTPKQWSFSEQWQFRLKKLLETYRELSDEAKMELDRIDWWRYLVQNGCDDRDLTIRELLDTTDFGEGLRHVSANVALSEYAESSEKNEMDFKIQGGNSMLVNKLADKIGRQNIHTKHTVIRVEQGKEVVVHCENGKTFKADRLICTAPTFAIQRIKWEPELPTAKQQALQELQYARINKHAMLFEKRFWKDESFDLVSDQTHHYYYHGTKNQRSTKGVLISYSIGEKAAVIAAQSNDWNAAEVDRTLGPSFGNVRQLLTNQANYYWGEDAWSMGAYAMYGINQWFRLQPVLKEDFLLTSFAGEHIADWQGFMEGAVNTGEEAAEKI